MRSRRVSHRRSGSRTTDWVTKNPARAQGVRRGDARGGAWANTHHRESAEMLAKYAHNTPEQIDSYTRVTYGDKLPPELIQPNIDVASKYGVIKAAFPAAEIISPASA